MDHGNVRAHGAGWSRWVWLRVAGTCLFAAALLGCGAIRAPLTCPERGGPDWVQIESDHFVVKTDLPESAARDRITAFEQSFQLLSELAFRSSDPPAGRTLVIVFDRLEDYQEIGLPQSAGFFSSTDIDSRPLVVMRGAFSESARQLFQHELTHRFVRHFMPRAPSWLNEGLAEFYETLRIDGGQALIGGASHNHRFMDRLDRSSMPSATEILEASPEVFRDPAQQDRFYAGSWLFVSMLINGPERYRAPFWSFVHDLVDRRPAEAWWNSFAAVPPGELDEALADFIRNGEIIVRRAPFSPRPAVIGAPVRMPEEAIHTLWAELRLRAGTQDSSAKVRKELADAFAQSPHYAEAHHWSGLFALDQQEYGEAERQFLAALAIKPDEERYLQGLCATLYEREMAKPLERRDFGQLEEPMRLLAKRARSASALSLLGQYHATIDEPDEGLAFAERSVRLGPSCWECLDTLARIAFKKGQAGEAVDLQRRALAIMPESTSAKDILDRLRQYERAVAAARGSSPAAP